MEMRNARQQAQDLSRTSKFLDAFLSNEEVKNQEKIEAPEPQKPTVNGNSSSFRSDTKARFSDPPAPPPQQPLPEKPDAARSQSEAPLLKRVTTEKPKNGPSGTSPVRQDNLSQIIQLTEALNNAKREIDNQTVKMRDLEEMLQRERTAREAAEAVAKRLEGDTDARTNGTAKPSLEITTLQEAFEPTTEHTNGGVLELTAEKMPVATESDGSKSRSEEDARQSLLQSKMDRMLSEMAQLRDQVNKYKKQAEQATSERDADRKTLAEMVRQIRQRDEEAAALRAAAAAATTAADRARTRSKSNGRERSSTITARDPSRGRSAAHRSADSTGGLDMIAEDFLDDKPTLSRANTITPTPRSPSSRIATDQAIRESLPYASMISVVLLGMGLMAYINGWQPQPSRLDQ